MKRSLVMSFLKQHNPHICILQETHLVGSKIMYLKKPWVRYYYHATYSSYARGVSILIHKSLTYELLDVKLESRYVLLHVIIDALELLIVGIYIPPPATVSLLKCLIPILSSFATDNIIIAEDFNMFPNPSLDRLVSGAATDSALSKWASLYGLADVWRWKMDGSTLTSVLLPPIQLHTILSHG